MQISNCCCQIKLRNLQRLAFLGIMCAMTTTPTFLFLRPLHLVLENEKTRGEYWLLDRSKETLGQGT